MKVVQVEVEAVHQQVAGGSDVTDPRDELKKKQKEGIVLS